MAALPRSIQASELLLKANLRVCGPVTWPEPVPCLRPGVYLLELERSYGRAPINPALVRTWLDRVPGLRLDGSRPTAEALAARLDQFWWPQSDVLYIGCTAKPLGSRVGEFVRHVLGNRAPHRGGHWIKTLLADAGLRIWCSPCDNPVRAERRVLLAFRIALCAWDPRLSTSSDHELLPFANLQTEAWARKRHGLMRQTL
jgi:hypothetical protein